MDFSEFKPKKLDKSKNLLIYRTGPERILKFLACNDNLSQKRDYVLEFDNDQSSSIQAPDEQGIIINKKFKFIFSKLEICRNEFYRKI